MVSGFGPPWRPVGVVLLLVLCSIQACRPEADPASDQVPAWATGGSLHDATLDGWASGTDADKHATAAELLYVTFWKGRLQSDGHRAMFRERVEQLVRTLDEMAPAERREALASFDPLVSSRAIRWIVTEMVKGDKEVIESLWGMPPD